MRVIIAGSREFHNYRLLCEKCDEILRVYEGLDGVLPPIEIVSGGAKGADQLGEWYARDRGYSSKIFPANWEGFGRSAGYRRNEEMAKYAKENTGVLICFWNGVSRGSKHMIEIAKMSYLTVHVVEF